MILPCCFYTLDANKLFLVFVGGKECHLSNPNSSQLYDSKLMQMSVVTNGNIVNELEKQKRVISFVTPHLNGVQLDCLTRFLYNESYQQCSQHLQSRSSLLMQSKDSVMSLLSWIVRHPIITTAAVIGVYYLVFSWKSNRSEFLSLSDRFAKLQESFAIQASTLRNQGSANGILATRIEELNETIGTMKQNQHIQAAYSTTQMIQMQNSNEVHHHTQYFHQACLHNLQGQIDDIKASIVAPDPVDVFAEMFNSANDHDIELPYDVHL